MQFIVTKKRAALSLLLSTRGRPLRFILTGGTSALVQLLLLALLVHRGLHPIVADAISLVISAQVSFGLNSAFTWRDRFRLDRLPHRWVTYHVSILGTTLLNMLIFTLAISVLPPVLASALGALSAAGVNFMIGDRFIFRHGEGVAAQPSESVA